MTDSRRKQAKDDPKQYFHGKIGMDAWLYLNEFATKRRLTMAAAMTLILREHRTRGGTNANPLPRYCGNTTVN